MHAEGNTAAHMKESTIDASQTVNHLNGEIAFRYIARHYLCEFDGSLQRTYYMKCS
ncbi:MAG: YjbQ family protein [Bacillota bacterium]